jgi:hypothetical protein
VPIDVAAEIRELSDEYGSNQISAWTGVESSTVRRVISGEHQSYSEQLSARQTQQLLNNWAVL